MKYLLATRPAFLSITLLGVLAGAAHAFSRGAAPSAALLALALLGALLAHAGANVLNDVHDAQNGSDARNVERIAPFTGGSRFIQDGVLSAGTMRRLAWGLLGGAALVGGALLALTDERLLAYGVAGLVLATAYSAPPCALMSRGLGEVAVGAAWLLVVAGSDFVAAGRVDAHVGWVALPFGVQIALILLINQVPDYAADAAACKRNWVVRLGRDRAAALYGALLAAAYGTLAFGVALGALGAAALAAFAALPLNLLAASALARHHGEPARLRGPIVLTLAAALLFGLLLALALLFERL